MTGRKRAVLGRPPTMQAPRETILAAASRLFAEKGFEQTSLQDVAGAVGISKAAVYHYFQSKQVIYDEIVIGLLEGLCDHVGEAVAVEASADRQLQRFMTAHADYFETNYVAFVTLLHGVSGIGTDVRSQRQIEVRDRYEIMLRDLLAAGVAAGELRVDDIPLCARAILSMLNWMSRWYKPGGGKGAVEVAEYYFGLLYQGMRPDEGARAPQTGG